MQSCAHIPINPCRHIHPCNHIMGICLWIIYPYTHISYLIDPYIWTYVHIVFIYKGSDWSRVGRLDSFSDAEINFPSRLRDSIFSLSGHANEADNPFTIPSFVDGNYNFHDLEDVHMWLVPYVRGYNPWWCESPLSCFSMRQSVIDNVPLFTGIYKEKDTRAMTLKELILSNNFVLFLAG